MNWMAPFELGRQPDGGFGVSTSIPSKTIYVFSIYITAPGDMTRPPDPQPHDLPQRGPIFNGAPIQIDLGGGNYFCPEPLFLLIAGGIILTGVPVGGYVLFG